MTIEGEPTGMQPRIRGSGVPRCAEASMILRRLKVYEYTVRIPKPKEQLVFCAHCAAHLVLHGSIPDPQEVSDAGVWL